MPTPPPPVPSTRPAVPRGFKSKTLAAGLAFLLGWLGMHRFYLYGRRDPFGWTHLLGTALGLYGAQLLVHSARASVAGWALAVLGAISLLAGFLAAIVYGLRPDQKWDARFNPHAGRTNRSGWTVVFIVVFSLFIGAGLLMGGLAQMFAAYFEHQVQAGE